MICGIFVIKIFFLVAFSLFMIIWVHSSHLPHYQLPALISKLSFRINETVVLIDRTA